jgi:hypothetical protein
VNLLSSMFLQNSVTRYANQSRLRKQKETGSDSCNAALKLLRLASEKGKALQKKRMLARDSRQRRNLDKGRHRGKETKRKREREREREREGKREREGERQTASICCFVSVGCIISLPVSLCHIEPTHMDQQRCRTEAQPPLSREEQTQEKPTRFSPQRKRR